MTLPSCRLDVRPQTVAAQSPVIEGSPGAQESVEVHCVPGDAPEAKDLGWRYDLDPIVVEPRAGGPKVRERPSLAVPGARHEWYPSARLKIDRFDDFIACHRWARGQGGPDKTSVELVMNIDGWGIIGHVESASGSTSPLDRCLSAQLLGWPIDPLPIARHTVFRATLEFDAAADMPTISDEPVPTHSRQALPHGACLTGPAPWPQDEIETTLSIRDHRELRIREGWTVDNAAFERDLVSELVKHNLGAYRACYRKAREEGERFEGELDFLVRFDATGQVYSVKPGDFEGHNASESAESVDVAELEDCLAQALGELSLYVQRGYKTFTLHVNLALRDGEQGEEAPTGEEPCASAIHTIEAMLEERPWIDGPVLETVEEFATLLPSLNVDARARCLDRADPLIQKIVFKPHRLSRTKFAAHHRDALEELAHIRYSWIRDLLPDVPAMNIFLVSHGLLLRKLDRLEEAAQTLQEALEHPQDDEELAGVRQELADVLALIAETENSKTGNNTAPSP